jgi:hypothetical protein
VLASSDQAVPKREVIGKVGVDLSRRLAEPGKIAGQAGCRASMRFSRTETVL